jgi:proline iminopeptidase
MTKQTARVGSVIFGAALMLILFSGEISPRTDTQLWPQAVPFQTDFLGVSDLHRIYFELCGNPKGKPVFVLHGGPGAASSPYYRRFFNPEKFLVVLLDQRGCGKSSPPAELRENTTQDLVADIEKLRLHLKLGKIILFGGSWGSTLALAYAEAYPAHTDAMVLRGIFTSSQEEIDHYYRGVRTFFPDAYERLEKTLGQPPAPQAVLRLVQSENPETRKKGSRAWADYEFKISELEADDAGQKKMLDSPALSGLIYSLALIENHYLANRCFLEEGQLLRESDKLKNIPAVLVNGRYDMICPLVTAYRLHQKLPRSKLIIAEQSGHSIQEKPIERALLEAMRGFE